MVKKDRERRYDRYGPIVKMTEADNYVMLRRPGATPYVVPLKEWKLLSTEPVHPEDRQGAILHVGRVFA